MNTNICDQPEKAQKSGVVFESQSQDKANQAK